MCVSDWKVNNIKNKMDENRNLKNKMRVLNTKTKSRKSRLLARPSLNLGVFIIIMYCSALKTPSA